jgi:Transglycosylase SLT domain
MAHQAPQGHRRGLRLAVHAQRTRVIVAMIGCLLSVGTPVVLLKFPGVTSDGQPAGSPGDPAWLGVTGTLPGDPLPADGAPGDSGGAEPPGLPTPPNLPDGPLGIPAVVLGAYQSAERNLVASRPGCHLSWSVLAGIGRIESGHARGGRIDAAGNALGPILGPPLDGSPGVAAIADTDRGMLDQDTVWDRAVGPMQFIPSSWRSYSVDGNGDGVASPHSIYDSTLAAGGYLCSGGGDLSDPVQLQAAVFRYNHSATYVSTVLRWAHAYLAGAVPTAPAPIVVSNAPQAAALQAAAAPVATTQPAPPPPTTTSSPPPPLVTTPPPSPVTTPPPSPVTTTPVEPASNPPAPPSLTTDLPPTRRATHFGGGYPASTAVSGS